MDFNPGRNLKENRTVAMYKSNANINIEAGASIDHYKIVNKSRLFSSDGLRAFHSKKKRNKLVLNKYSASQATLNNNIVNNRRKINSRFYSGKPYNAQNMRLSSYNVYSTDDKNIPIGTSTNFTGVNDQNSCENF